jgi:hypothetical protein
MEKSPGLCSNCPQPNFTGEIVSFNFHVSIFDFSDENCKVILKAVVEMKFKNLRIIFQSRYTGRARLKQQSLEWLQVALSSKSR